MQLEVVLNALAIILFLGFGMAGMIAFSTVDKQKEIQIVSRYGRQTEPMEIIFVNVALLMVVAMLWTKNYRFLPALVVFVVLVILNSQMRSGFAPTGVFIGSTYLEWNRIKRYRIVNDQISTIQIQVFANQKCYVLRCEKKYRTQIEALFEQHKISAEQAGEIETSKDME